MDYKKVLGIVPGLQSTALVGYNLGQTKKMFKLNKCKIGMKKPVKRLVKTGVVNLTGIGLINATAGAIK